MKVNFYNYTSFGAMKKSQFSGLDLACVETFKAPIEKFNTQDDLDKWAQDKLAPKLGLDQYANKRESETKQRFGCLQCWKDYLNLVNGACALVIFDSITKDVKSNNREQPPIFNSDVFAKTVQELDSGKNFKKSYENNLRLWAMGDDGVGTKWIKIPSKEHDPENFETNAQRLNVLSSRTWCTKAEEYTKNYLSEGELHIYMENSKPKIAIFTTDDKIEEIQGLKNNSRVPYEYAQIIEDYIKENNLKDNVEFEEAINTAKQDAIRFKNLKAEIAGKDYDEILKKCGIEVSYKDNKRILSEYKQPDPAFTWLELGVNENDLLKDVVEITGDAYFGDSLATDLSSLERIGGYVTFMNSCVTDISNLKSIGDMAEFGDSLITDVSSLEYVGGDVRIDSRLTPEQFKHVEVGGEIIYEG